jgi:hypothetical protein
MASELRISAISLMLRRLDRGGLRLSSLIRVRATSSPGLRPNTEVDLVQIRTILDSIKKGKQPVLARDRRKASGYLTMNETAKKIGCIMQALRKAIDGGYIPEPQRIGFAARGYYHTSQLPELKRLWRNIPQGHKPIPDGLYNVKMAAKAIGMPTITLVSWIDREWIKPPSHEWNGRGKKIKYYTRAEVVQIANLRKQRLSRKAAKLKF